MIKFFRKIRQNLLMENKTGKYLKYAIGEIVLVVIGILIALQINNWNENRKSTAIEQYYLKRLKNSLVEDTVNINLTVTGINQALDLIDSVTKNSPKPKINKNLSSLTPRLYMSTFRLDIETSTFDDLKSTGNFNLIKNKALIKTLSTYYKQAQGINTTLNGSLETYSRNSIGPYIMKNYYIAFVEGDFSTEMENQFVLTANELKQDLFLINSLGFRKGLLTALKAAYMDELTHAKKILSVIEKEE